jgi:hypothetical protein
MPILEQEMGIVLVVQDRVEHWAELGHLRRLLVATNEGSASVARRSYQRYKDTRCPAHDRGKGEWAKRQLRSMLPKIQVPSAGSSSGLGHPWRNEMHIEASETSLTGRKPSFFFSCFQQPEMADVSTYPRYMSRQAEPAAECRWDGLIEKTRQGKVASCLPALPGFGDASAATGSARAARF